MELHDLPEQYQHEMDEELLRLALDLTPLTSEANAVLNDELARRRINSTERLTALRDPRGKVHGTFT